MWKPWWNWSDLLAVCNPFRSRKQKPAQSSQPRGLHLAPWEERKLLLVDLSAAAFHRLVELIAALIRPLRPDIALHHKIRRAIFESLETRRYLDAVTVDVRSTTVEEGQVGDLVVCVSGPLTGPATVTYNIADGSAQRDVDFFLPEQGTLTFEPGGPTAQTLPFLTRPESPDDPTKSFSVTLSNPTGPLSLGSSETLCTILGQGPAATVNTASPPQTGAGTGAAASGSSAAPALPAQAPNEPSTAGLLGFTLPAMIFPPSILEGRLFMGPLPPVTLVAADGGAAPLAGTAANQPAADDTEVPLGPATVAVQPLTIQAGQVGCFVVELSGPVNSAVSVDFSVSDGTAQQGRDFLMPASGTLQFEPGGATSHSLAVLALRQCTGGSGKSFTLTLSNPSGPLALGTSQATCTIVGTDPAAAPSPGDALAGASGEPAQQALDAANEGFSLPTIGGGLGPMAMDAGAQQSPPGSLDPSFGSGGTASFTFDPDSLECINFLTADSEGRILVSGYTTAGQEQICRYYDNGCLDSSFGGGYVGLPDGAWLEAAAVEPAAGTVPEKIVLVMQSGYTLMVERLLDNGSPDPAFNGSNMATLALDDCYFNVSAVSLIGSQIYVAGNLYGNNQPVAALVSFNDQGLVSNFGGTGPIATMDLGGGFVNDMAVQPGGDLVLAGCEYDGSGSQAVLCRFTAAGARDGSFGGQSTGVAVSASVADWISVACQPDGTIAALSSGALSSSSAPVVVRYSADGQAVESSTSADFLIDSSFAGGQSPVIAVEAGDQIVLAAVSDSNGEGVLRIGRLIPSGNVDTDFGSGGATTTCFDVGGGWTGCASLAMSADGADIIVTVPYFNSSPNDSCSILLAQYLGGPDLLPSLTLSNANPVDEGQSASFQVTLSATSPYDVSAYYSTSNGSALAGQNYVARSPGMVVIPAGENTASISVATIDDGIDGPSECFNLTVTGASNASVSGTLTASAWILNIDGPPAVTVGNAGTVNEGEKAWFPITLSARSGYDVSVYYNTSDGSASAGQNYAGPSPGMVVIPAGQTTASVGVQTIDDGIVAPDEGFYLNVTGADGATTSGGLTASATIHNIDSPPSISGPSSFAAGSTYELNLSAGHLGELVIDHWNINWGDGQTQTIPGNPSSVPHSYAAFGQYQITAVAVDTRGGSHAATPGPGDLDETVGADGLTTVGLGPDDPACITFSAVDSSGRILVGGSVANGGYQLSRYLDDGSLDPGFGDGSGRVAVSAAGTYISPCIAIAAGAQGDIVAAYTSGSALDVECLLDDGSLDPLFHGGHVVQVTFLQGTFQNLSAVRIDGGQVFVAGAFHDNSQGCIVPAVACLDGQGPVAAFGNAGLAEVAVPGGWATDLAIQPEEGVVLLGQGYVNSGNHSFLTQFSLNGSVVGCFGTGGMLVNSSSGYWNALATQSDGSIVVAGYSYASSSSMVQRFGSEGQGPEDPAGTAVAGDPALSAIPWSNVAIQADDSIVLAGPLYDGAANSLAVAQLASDGSVDTAFGDSGITGTVFQNSTYLNSPLFLRMSVDGDIAAGGYYYPNSSPARYIDAAHYLDGLPVTVTAPPPAVSLGGDPEVEEGSTWNALGSFSGGNGATFTGHISFGDGFQSSLNLTAGKTFQVSHTYATQGTYPATVTITDSSGAVGTATVQVKVDDVLPQVKAVLDGVVNEGGRFTASGSFTDPAQDTWTATVDYGDGQGGVPTLNAQEKTFSFNHVYGASGTYTGSITLVAGDGTTCTTPFVVTVNNVAPVASFGGNLSRVSVVLPNAFVATGSFVDPGSDTCTATVDYGDGQGGPLTLTGKTFSLSHTYAAVGAYAVRVAIEDGNQAVGTATLAVNVGPPAPQLQLPADATITEGQTLTGSGSFSETGTFGPWTAKVDYGDGQGAQTLTLNADQTFSLSHPYCDPGTYTVTVRITDGQPCVGSGTFKVTVNDAAPVVVVTGNSQVTEADRYVLTLQANEESPHEIVAWTVDWNDGTPLQTFSAGPGQQVEVDHYFEQAGTFNVSVTATNEAQQSAGQTLSVAVVGPPPKLSVSDGGTTIANDATVTLPDTTQGMPFPQTFTISNFGAGPLTLVANLLSLPTGWTLVGAFPTSVAPLNGTADFTVLVAATSIGSYSGAISFQCNDTDAEDTTAGTFAFTVSGDVVADLGAPRIEGLGLANDPHLPSADPTVHPTYDPTIQGTVRGDYGGGYFGVQFELGTSPPDYLVQVPASQRTFTYDLRQNYTVGSGLLPLRYRLVSCDSNGNNVQALGDWCDFSLDLQADPASGSLRVDDLGLQSTSNASTSPPTTYNPALVGAVAGDFGGATVRVQFAHNGDNKVDGWVDVTTPGQVFRYDPRTFDPSFCVAASTVESIAYRVVKLDGNGQPASPLPSWSSGVSYTLLPPPAATYSLTLALKNFSWENGNETTSDATLTGSVQDGSNSPVPGALVQLDLNDDGVVDDVVKTDGNGNFTFQPKSLPGGQVTIQARTVEWNATDQVNVLGDWQQLTFIYKSVPGISSFQVANEAGSDGDTQITSDGLLSGQLDSAQDLTSVQVEIDLDDDGTPDATTEVSSDGSFQYQLANFGTEAKTIQARTRRSDPSGQTQYGTWTPLTVQYQPPAVPDVTDLALDNPLDGTPPLAFDPSFHGQLDGAADASGTTIELKYNDDSTVDATTTTNVYGYFDFRPQGLTAGTVTIHVCASRWDAVAGEQIVSPDWTDLPYDYEPVPAVDTLALDTTAPASAPSVTGTLAPTTGIGYVAVEIDRQIGSTLVPNGYVTPDSINQGQFSYSPIGLSFGSVTLVARAYWEDATQAKVYGLPMSLTFNYAPVATPVIASLGLTDVTDGLGAGDLPVSSDPTLGGQLTGGSAGGVYILFEQLNAQSNWTKIGYTQSDPTGCFSYCPTDLDTGLDPITVRATAFVRDPSNPSGLLTSDAKSCSFHLLASPNPISSAATVDVQLADGTQSGGTTSDPTLTGQISVSDGSSPGYLTVQFAYNGDSSPDASTTADSSGGYTLQPTDLSPGSVSVSARVKQWDDADQQYAYGDWSSPLTFTLVGAETATAAIDMFQPRSPSGVFDSHDPPLPYTSNLLLTGHVAASTDLPGLTVQFSRDGGATVTGTAAVDSQGNFQYQPEQLAYGPVTISARTSWWNESQGQYVTGSWTETSFDYRAPTGAAPQVTLVGLATNLGTSSDPLTTDPTITGQVDSENALSDVMVDFDTNNDGTAEATVVCDAQGNFSYTLPSLSYGTRTIRVRAREFDAASGAARVETTWTPLTFDYEAAPVLSGLALADITQSPPSGLITSDPTITGAVTDPAAEVGATLSMQFDLTGDGSIGGTAPVTDGSFRYVPYPLSAGAVSLRARAVLTTRDSQQIFGDWQTICFTYAPSGTTASGHDSASSVHDAGVAQAAAAQDGAANSANAIYAAHVAAANATYAAGIATAEGEYAANLTSYGEEGANTTSFSMPDFTWPDAPADNAVVVPDDSTQPAPPVQAPTYDGPAFDPTDDPVYQMDVTVAQYLHDSAAETADAQLAAKQQDAETVYQTNVDGAEDTYNGKMSDAANNYDDAINGITPVYDPTQAWDDYQNARQGAFDTYSSDLTTHQQDYQSECDNAWAAYQQQSNAAWNDYQQQCGQNNQSCQQTIQNATDQYNSGQINNWDDFHTICTNAQNKCQEENAADYRDAQKAVAGYYRDYQKTCADAEKQWCDDDSTSANTECGQLADADNVYADKMAANQQHSIEATCEAQNVRDAAEAGAAQTLAKDTADYAQTRDEKIADAQDEHDFQVAQAEDQLTHDQMTAKQDAVGRWAARQSDAQWAAYQVNMVNDEAAYSNDVADAAETEADAVADATYGNGTYYNGAQSQAYSTADADHQQAYDVADAIYARDTAKADAAEKLTSDAATLDQTRAGENATAWSTLQTTDAGAQNNCAETQDDKWQTYQYACADDEYQRALADADAVYQSSLPNSTWDDGPALNADSNNCDAAEAVAYDAYAHASVDANAQAAAAMNQEQTTYQEAYNADQETYLSSLADLEGQYETSWDASDPGIAAADETYAQALVQATTTHDETVADAADALAYTTAEAGQTYADKQAEESGTQSVNNAVHESGFELVAAQAYAAALQTWSASPNTPWAGYQYALAQAEVTRVTEVGSADVLYAQQCARNEDGWTASGTGSGQDWAHVADGADCAAAEAQADAVCEKAHDMADNANQAAQAMSGDRLTHDEDVASATTEHDQSTAQADQQYQDQLAQRNQACWDAQDNAEWSYEHTMSDADMNQTVGLDQLYIQYYRHCYGDDYYKASDAITTQHSNAAADAQTASTESSAKAEQQRSEDVAFDRHAWIYALAGYDADWVGNLSDAADTLAGNLQSDATDLASNLAGAATNYSSSMAQAVHDHDTTLAGANQALTENESQDQDIYDLSSADAASHNQELTTQARDDYQTALYVNHHNALAQVPQSTLLVSYQTAVAAAGVVWAEAVAAADSQHESDLYDANHQLTVDMNAARDAQTQADAAAQYAHDTDMANAQQTESVNADTAQVRQEQALAVADARQQYGLATAETAYKRQQADADETSQKAQADAEQNWVTSVADAQYTYWTSPEDNAAADAYNQAQQAADDAQQSADQEAQVAHAKAIGAGQIALAGGQGEAEVQRAVDGGKADVTYAVAQNRVDSVYSRASSSAETALAQATAYDQSAETIAEARAQADFTAAQGAADVFQQGTSSDADVTYSSTTAEAEAAYAIATAQAKASAAAAWAARTGASADDQFQAEYATLDVEWLASVASSYVAFATASAQADAADSDMQTLDQAAADNGAAADSLAATVLTAPKTAAHDSEAAAAQGANDTAATAAQGVQTAAYAQADASRAAAYAQAESDWDAAYSKAEEDYQVSIASADTSDYGKTYTDATALADRDQTKARADADLVWSTAYAAADKQEAIAQAGADQTLAVAQAGLDAGLTVAEAQATAAQDVADAGVQAAQWNADTAADNAEQYALASDQADFLSAQYAAASAVVSGMAATLSTPWAQFEAQLAVARQQAWEQMKAGYLASVAADNLDAANYQNTVGSDYITQVQTTAGDDVTRAQQTDDQTRQTSEAQIAADYELGGTSEGVSLGVGMAQATYNYAVNMAQDQHDYATAEADATYDWNLGNYSEYDDDISAEDQAQGDEPTVQDRFGVDKADAVGGQEVADAQAEQVYASDSGTHDQACTDGNAAAQQTYTDQESDLDKQRANSCVARDDGFTEARAQGESSALAALALSNGTPWAKLAAARDAALATWTDSVAGADITCQTDPTAGIDKAQNTYERSVAAADAVFASSDEAATVADALSAAGDALTQAQNDAGTIQGEAAAGSYLAESDLPTLATAPQIDFLGHADAARDSDYPAPWRFGTPAEATSGGLYCSPAPWWGGSWYGYRWSGAAGESWSNHYWGYNGYWGGYWGGWWGGWAEGASWGWGYYAPGSGWWYMPDHTSDGLIRPADASTEASDLTANQWTWWTQSVGSVAVFGGQTDEGESARDIFGASTYYDYSSTWNDTLPGMGSVVDTTTLSTTSTVSLTSEIFGLSDQFGALDTFETSSAGFQPADVGTSAAGNHKASTTPSADGNSSGLDADGSVSLSTAQADGSMETTVDSLSMGPKTWRSILGSMGRASLAYVDSTLLGGYGSTILTVGAVGLNLFTAVSTTGAVEGPASDPMFLFNRDNANIAVPGRSIIGQPKIISNTQQQGNVITECRTYTVTYQGAPNIEESRTYSRILNGQPAAAQWQLTTITYKVWNDSKHDHVLGAVVVRADWITYLTPSFLRDVASYAFRLAAAYSKEGTEFKPVTFYSAPWAGPTNDVPANTKPALDVWAPVNVGTALTRLDSSFAEFWSIRGVLQGGADEPWSSCWVFSGGGPKIIKLPQDGNQWNEKIVIAVPDTWTTIQVVQWLLTDSTIRSWYVNWVVAVNTNPKIQQMLNDRVVDAAKQAAAIAEFYVKAVAGVSAAGQIVVSLDDLSKGNYLAAGLGAVLVCPWWKLLKPVVIRLAGGVPFELTEAIVAKLRGLSEDVQVAIMGELRTCGNDVEAMGVLAERKVVEGVEWAAYAERVLPKPPPSIPRGQWVFEPEGFTFSARAKAYQKQITGQPAGLAYRVNGRDFDGWNASGLLDAKGEGYAWAVVNGRFRQGYKGAAGILSEARSQLRAANGTQVTWHVAEQDTLRAIENLFADQPDKDNLAKIILVFDPLKK